MWSSVAATTGRVPVLRRTRATAWPGDDEQGLEGFEDLRGTPLRLGRDVSWI